MAQFSPNQFNGNWSAAYNYAQQQLGQTPSSGIVQYLAYGNTNGLSDQDVATMGIQKPASLIQKDQQQAQDLYNAQQGSAISTLQTGKTNLSQQYADLLKTVKGEYQPLIDQATLQQNAQNASRGIVSSGGIGGTAMISALNPIYSAQATNAQQIGQGSISDINAYNNAISALQSGQAATNLNIPTQYGSLAMSETALPYQLALTQAQTQAAPIIPTSYGGVLFNAGNQQITNPMLSALQQMGYKLTP